MLQNYWIGNNSKEQEHLGQAIVEVVKEIEIVNNDWEFIVSRNKYIR